MKRTTFIQVAALGASLLVGSLPDAVQAEAARVEKTGQRECWDRGNANISCDSIPKEDPMYGQDGQLQKGVAWPVPRFVPLVNQCDDTGVGGGTAGNRICDGTERCNGVVKDRLTNLKWLANTNCFGGNTWYFAMESANALRHGQCGLRDGSRAGDWRLPNVKELQSLMHFGCQPKLPDRQGTGCVGQDPNPVFSGPWEYYFWSSTTEGANVEGDTGGPMGSAWRVNFYTRFNTFYEIKGITSGPEGMTWPVRGGP